MNQTIKLYRKRHIPDEFVFLDKDEILLQTESRLITRWKTLKPRSDFASGISVFDFEKHWKITKIMRSDGSLHQWYCDICKLGETKEPSTIIMEDLLIDVIIDEYGQVDVVDLDEAAEAFEKNMISVTDLTTALYAADELLRLIRHGGFSEYQSLINSFDSTLPQA